MPKDRHARFLLGLLYAGLGVGALWLCMRFLLPWLAPFLIALALAALLEPGVRLLSQRLHAVPAAEVRFGGIISQYLKFFTIKFKTSFYYAILGTVENAGVPGARRICGGAGCRGRPRSI